MEYKGKLFGKVGKQYFPLLETTEDVDNLKNQNKELLECLKESQKAFQENLKLADYKDEIIMFNCFQKNERIIQKTRT